VHLPTRRSAGLSNKDAIAYIVHIGTDGEITPNFAKNFVNMLIYGITVSSTCPVKFKVKTCGKTAYVFSHGKTIPKAFGFEAATQI
jgi:hypothetical protein